MAGYLDSVAIIGAGLGGCALGLALSARDIPVTIYESRSEVSGVNPSGVILTPNGLRILDRLGVLERVKDRCYVTTSLIFLNEKGEVTKDIPWGGPEVHGYWNHRIWRGLLLDEMRLMLKERNIPIHNDSKFNGIVSESSSDGIEFLINDDTHQTSLLIGSDGIYSTLRTHLSPSTQPTYTGLLGILAHIPWSSVSWPSPDFPRNATLQGKPASIFWIAEDPPSNPSPQIMVGLQTQHDQELSRSDLESLQNDKSRLLDFYKKGYNEHGPLAQKIIDAVEQYKETLYIWPFMKMPKMENWYSTKSGRIILVGDGAHALPPSSGQGVNQALEDVYSLVLVLEEASKGSTDGAGKEGLLEALEFWQKTRQDRIDAIYDWTTNTNNVNRLPEAERQKLMKDGKIRVDEDRGWLFQCDYDEVVKDWAEKRKER